jgi:ATP-binding cassette, subfamily B, bacterial
VATGIRSDRRAGWRLLRSMMRAERRGIVLGVSFGLVWTVAKVSVPLLAGVAIDQGIEHPRHGRLLLWALVILGVGVVVAVTTGARRYQAFSIALRAETDLRQRMFAHLQRLHFAYHDRAQTGQLMARSATDLQQINGLFTLIPITIANATIVSGVTVILLLVNLKLAVLTLVSLPMLNVVAKLFSSKIHPASMGLQAELAELSVLVEETVSGIRVVKGFGAEPVFADRMKARAEAVYDRAMDTVRVRGAYLPSLDFIPALGVIAVVWYGGHQVHDHHLTLGQLTSFYLYVLLLINPLRMTGMLVAQAQRAVAAAQRIDDILVTEPAIVDAAHPVPLPAGSGEVRFEGVRFGYDGARGPAVLDGFNLVVQPGEAVALVGATGSGKTTVAKLLPRFYDLDAGRILIDGADIRDVRVRDVRRAVSIVFEDTFLFTDTVRANIAFAHPEASDDEVERAARLAGANEFIVELDDGYNTVIGERGYSLSGGQRQRLALARAILADPRVLILDDATSAVDPTKEHEIRDALTEVMRGRTTIVIAHRPATIALADRVVLLAAGKVIAEGTHVELLTTSEAYREVLARAEPEDRGRQATPDLGVGVEMAD